VDIEKKMVVAAPIDEVWRLLIDPKVMAGCVPGVQSVQVLSDTEYLAEIKVKISFISANFKIKTTILESRPPHYLRCEGTGEDSSVASSLKQTTEMFLTEVPGGTEVRTKTKAEVFGRLGSFGLSVMKTKADRMWEDFGANFAAILRQHPSSGPEPQRPSASGRAALASAPVETAATARSTVAAPQARRSGGSWWTRLAGAAKPEDNMRELRLATDIYFELHRGGDVIKILWPAHDSKAAAAWLKDITRE
jgi:carbon monoxide dehydrogenase subunit G